MAYDQTREHAVPYQGPIFGYCYCRLCRVRPLDFLAGNMPNMYHLILQFQAPRFL